MKLVRDGFSFGEDVAQIFCPQNISQSGRREQSSRSAVVVNVGHRAGCICHLLVYVVVLTNNLLMSTHQPHLVVHDGVDKDSDAVLGENLLRGDLVGGGPHVDLLVDVDAGDDEEDTGTSSSSRE